ncbi:MAG: acylphosphatase [Candidatus Methanomethylicia archaeon]
MVKKRILVKGPKVQDVGYRLFLYHEAEALGLIGLQARNLGRDVEILVEGSEECIKEFIEFIRENYPKNARVKEIEVYDYNGKVMEIDRYYRSLTVEQLAKIVDAGLGVMKGQGKMLKKQDLMIQKQDEMLKKQDEVLIEIKGLRRDFKDFIDERFKRVEEDISKIKEKIGAT